MRVRARLSAPVVVALTLAGCGGAQTHSRPISHARIAAAFRGAPAPLAALHAQADELLGGGLADFRARLAALRGYPVVVNKWASWCGPCQSEFPVFEQVSVRLGGRVAFIGLDGKDGNGSAAAFLSRFPVTYPSYTDPHETIAAAFDASTYYPQTLFFTRTGHSHYVFDHDGPYLSAAALQADIEHYLLR